MNIYSKKTRKKIVTVIAIVCIVLMLATVVASLAFSFV